MRQHPKIRKIVKWGGAVASVLLAVVWVGTRWVSAGYWSDAGFSFEVGAGRLLLVHDYALPGGPSPPGWYWERWSWKQSWVPEWRVGVGYLYLEIPAYFFVVPVVSVTAAAWWLDRRSRCWALLGACTKCGYDRAGIAAGAVCPECGAGTVKEALNAKSANGSKQ